MFFYMMIFRDELFSGYRPDRFEPRQIKNVRPDRFELRICTEKAVARAEPCPVRREDLRRLSGERSRRPLQWSDKDKDKGQEQ